MKNIKDLRIDYSKSELDIQDLSDEPIFEPPIRFKKAGRDGGFSDEDIWIMKVGETRSIAPTQN